MNTKTRPIVSWGIWAFGMSLVLGIVTSRQIGEGFASDSTGMSIVITALFVVGFVTSGIAAKILHTEWAMLNDIRTTGEIPPSDDPEGLATILAGFAEAKENGEIVNIGVSIDTYHARHNSRVRSVSIMAALCISMGLLGTVIGLIISIQGLGGMVNEIGVSQVAMMGKLKTVVSGMGTAFYTTFYGALAGLILRAVCVSQLNSLTELCTMATEFAERNLAVKRSNKEEALGEQASSLIQSFEKMKEEIEAVTSRISSAVDSSIANFGNLLDQAGQRTVETAETTFRNMSSHVEMLGGEVGSAFSEFNSHVEASGTEVRASVSGLSESIGTIGSSVGDLTENIEGSFAELNRTLGNSGESLSGAFGEINSSIETAGDQMAASLSEFTGAIDTSSQEVESSAHELKKTVQSLAGEVREMAQDRLNKEAEIMAGQLRLAADQFSIFLKERMEPAVPTVTTSTGVELEDDASIILDDEENDEPIILADDGNTDESIILDSDDNDDESIILDDDEVII